MPVRMRAEWGMEFQGLRPTQGILVMLIRIRGTDGGEPYGDLIQYSLQEPMPFRNTKELVFRIAEVGRLLRPEEGEEFRTLRGGRGREHPGKRRGLSGRSMFETEEDIYLRFPSAGVKEQLCLKLVGRHNMSLQGRIRGRLTKGRPVSFRSAMELMAMLSELEL